jgi:hypothetical protein
MVHLHAGRGDSGAPVSVRVDHRNVSFPANTREAAGFGAAPPPVDVDATGSDGAIGVPILEMPHPSGPGTEQAPRTRRKSEGADRRRSHPTRRLRWSDLSLRPFVALDHAIIPQFVPVTLLPGKDEPRVGFVRILRGGDNARRSVLLRRY